MHEEIITTGSRVKIAAKVVFGNLFTASHAAMQVCNCKSLSFFLSAWAKIRHVAHVQHHFQVDRSKP